MIDISVSLFKDVFATKPMSAESLYAICSTPKYKSLVNQLRALPKGSEEYNTLKKTLPCFTPSMTCTQRAEQYMIEHSGFVCLDWDNVESPEEFKQMLKDFDFIAFAAISCSGRGLYAMVRIDRAELHRQHYEALLSYFDKLGYPADTKCKDIARLRIVSYDPHYYYNQSATVWRETEQAQQQLLCKRDFNVEVSDKYERAIYAIRNYVVACGVDITAGRNNWLAMGNYIYSVLGSMGEDLFCDISMFHPNYRESECRKVYHRFGEGRYQPYLGALLNACSRAGVPPLKILLSNSSQ